jgi:hypothetical protein
MHGVNYMFRIPKKNPKKPHCPKTNGFFFFFFFFLHIWQVMFTFLMIEYPGDNYHIIYCATSMPIQISRGKRSV